MIDTPPWVEIAAAVFTSGAVLLWALVDRREHRDLLVAWVGATALTMVALNGAPMALVFAVAATLVAPVVSDVRLRGALIAGGVAATVLIMTHDIDSRLILGALVVTAIVGPSLWYLDRTHGHPVVLLLIGGSALGIYINVPDTEQIVVLATALPILAAAMFIFSSLRTSIVSFEALALVGALVVASGAVGARGRVESFVGVIGAIGILVAEPIAMALRRGTRAYAHVIIAVHAAAVIIASRVAGTYGPLSLTATVAATLAGTTALLIVLPRQPLDQPSPRLLPARTRRPEPRNDGR